MRASKDVLDVWRRFDGFPMETITKAWYSQMDTEPRQRTVEQMQQHREQYGTSGNCFDLAIWLIDEFRQQELHSYAILTPHSHVAVVAVSGEGKKYLCDLGDQWIEPILIDDRDEAYTSQFLDGFFPGAKVKLNVQPDHLVVQYKRPNGKTSLQTFYLRPLSEAELIAAGEKAQQTLRRPLVEKRLFLPEQIAHWEFDADKSFISYQEGREEESQLDSIEAWAERISGRSGIAEDVVRQALRVYAERSQ